MLQQTFTQRKIGETVYLNVTITNPDLNTKAVPASISSTLRTPLVENPSLYDFIIGRISVPGRSIPLFFYQTVPFPNTNPNTGIYSVTIGYQGNYSAPVNLIYVPETLTPPINQSFSVQTPNQDQLDTYYYAYSYVNLANMVTTALRTAITSSAAFLPLGVDAYMIYNNKSGFFSLLGTTNMANSASPFDPNNVQIYFNTPLSTFFTGFKSIHNSYNNPNGRDELILIENNLNNSSTAQDGFNPNIPNNYYQMQLEFNSDSSLETLSKVSITSNTLGGVVAQNEINNLGDRAGLYQSIIADFIPAVPVNSGDFRSKIQYFAQSEFYRRTLTQTTPLTEINLSFFWQGIRPNILRQILLEPGDSATLLGIFERR